MTPAAITMPAAAPGSHRLAQFAGVLRAEFCKLWTVRATWWALTSVLAFNIATAVLLGIFLPSRLSAHDKATLDSTRVSLGGLHLSQVAIGLLGVLVITSEYGSGMIRATLAAVPQRRLMLAAKTLTFAAAATVTGLAASFAAYLLFQIFLPAGDAMRTTLMDPGVLRAVTGAGLYLAVLGLFGLGLGTILRSSAGAVAALLGDPVRAHHPHLAAARLVAARGGPLPPDGSQRGRLLRPAPALHPAALDRVRRVLRLRRGCPHRRIRPDQPQGRVNLPPRR